MIIIPYKIIEAAYAHVDKGWYPSHMLAMETSKNRISVIITVTNVNNHPDPSPFVLTVADEETEAKVLTTYYGKIKNKWVSWFGSAPEIKPPVVSEEVVFDVEYILLEQLISNINHSHHRAIEIASYADVSSQFWMAGPFEDNFDCAQLYTELYATLMEAASVSVNWIVVESEYLNEAYNANEVWNFPRYVEMILRSRYVHFCQSICFDLELALSYIPEVLQQPIRSTLARQKIHPAAESGLREFCERVIETGPPLQIIFTQGAGNFFFKMLKTQRTWFSKITKVS